MEYSKNFDKLCGAPERCYPGAEAPHTMFFGKIIKAEQF